MSQSIDIIGTVVDNSVYVEWNYRRGAYSGQFRLDNIAVDPVMTGVWKFPEQSATQSAYTVELDDTLGLDFFQQLQHQITFHKGVLKALQLLQQRTVEDYDDSFGGLREPSIHASDESDTFTILPSDSVSSVGLRSGEMEPSVFSERLAAYSFTRDFREHYGSVRDHHQSSTYRSVHKRRAKHDRR